MPLTWGMPHLPLVLTVFQFHFFLPLIIINKVFKMVSNGNFGRNVKVFGDFVIMIAFALATISCNMKDHDKTTTAVTI